MSAYMKNRFQFFGIRSPERKKLFADYLKKFPPPNDSEIIFEFVRQCWEMEERELHYCALELLIKNHRLWGPDDLPFFEYLITRQSWWDTVDSIAPNVLGKWFLKYPENIPQSIDSWLLSDNIWLQRCCLLFQLKYKAKTDTDLLEKVIVELKDSREFFIRKAIGWALRQYAKIDPHFVLEFTRRHKLSTLSQREALKHL